ncbi:helix-turn-helix protein [Faecalimonas umbilicata]|uniref:Helix-turn-helix protein n=1 Tax=Faecalimonas umbilicata TaxID=1912855 RepID=A0A4R3JQR2_9FIRM|nr:helix-turn-helix transcriptional regulator [Faecalimonas umbilicata]TCS67755.1 helix-turn-helix protein [Faecalimonas umbilicata]GBU04785.1 transcriptional regulator [Faecalimonas umbilicata]
MSFSEDIKEVRKQNLMSQTEFARALGVSFSTVNRWETGKTLPAYKAMKSIELFCSKHGVDFSNSKNAWKENK